MAEINGAHEARITLSCVLILILVLRGVHNGSADAPVVKHTRVSHRAVIIRALELLDVTHTLYVEDNIFGLLIRLLLLTSHASVQVIVLLVLFKLFAASVLVIHAHQLGGIHGHELLVVGVARRLIKYGRVSIVQAVGFYGRQIREVSLPLLHWINLSLVFENRMLARTTSGHSLLSQLEIRMRCVIICILSPTGLVKLPSGALSEQDLIDPRLVARARIRISRGCSSSCSRVRGGHRMLFIHY